MMTVENDPSSSTGGSSRESSLRRLAPLIAIGCLSIVVITMGWHWGLSLATLSRHHDVLQDFIAAHEAAAIAGYIALYIAVVALSLPVGAYLTVIGGILFGAVVGGMAAVVGASIGAILIFLIAKSALGEHLMRRAGPAAEKIAEGFRADAFSYLLFLRLVPVFPFWLLNLVSALCGVRLAPFAAATVLGIMPATFAFAVVGSGLESVIVAEESARWSWKLVAALAALGVLALVPILAKRLRARFARDTR